jgi:alpha-D-xyloside xylohydrolase
MCGASLALAVMLAGRASAIGPPPFPVGDGQLKIEVCTDDVIRVAYARDEGFFARRSLMAAPKQCVPTVWTLAETQGTTTITTAALQIAVANGTVSFRDRAGKVILAERQRTLQRATIMGEKTFHVRQQWQPQAGESLYGLGQHQHGLLDITDVDMQLRQYNTEIFVPLLVSSRGYGLLWDNTSFTRYGSDVEPAWEDVAVAGKPWVDRTTTMAVPVSGTYVFRAYSSGGIKLSVDGKRVIDHWRQGWLPGEDIARVHLTAGKPVPVTTEWESDGRVPIARVAVTPPPRDGSSPSLWSEVGDGIDYYFIHGPDIDRVIAGYRRITGAAPMLPRWAFGLWQSRERYSTQAQSLEVLRGYRRRGIPIDVIVQDWRYWRDGQWGSHAFDPARFPDPAGWVAELHDRLHARVMISVWPKFYRGTANFAALDAAGFLYRPNLAEGKQDWLKNVFTYYDAFNPAARQLYWSQIHDALATKGIDAWWTDATEPEVVEGPFPSIAAQVTTYQTHMHPTAEGSGARMLNAYSLVNGQAIYEGQRAAAPTKRVVILTRNGFAGTQRFGAVSWSGDISSTWTALRKQIPAGLGFAISGMPYWTFDSGGFAVPGHLARAARGSRELDEWCELATRWFQLAAFVPIMRVHGQAPKREMWEYGGDGSPAYEAQLKLDRLRYRLLPYVYSLAGAAALDGGTMMRPLVMDFRDDLPARRIADQFMFGPSLMVSPVTAYKVIVRQVYLPPTAGGWYDFWTGRGVGAGMQQSPAPFDTIPVHVRAGAILPFGPELQYTDEKPADPITLRIYTGADGAFTLYEDDGISNDYERGAFTRIPMRWDDRRQTLTIGKRAGSFPGMLARRTFDVVLFGARSASKRAAYKGDPVTVAFR